MTEIYHFANTGFCLPFLDQYPDFPKEILNKITVKVIFSYEKENIRFIPCRNWYRKIQQKKQEKEYQRQFSDFPFDIEVVQNVNASDFFNKIPEGSIGICSGFDQIFSAELITCFKSFINVHPSILPYYRGPVPSYWCIENKEQYSGFTFHEVTTRIDEGEIFLQKKVKISSDETEYTLNQKIAKEASQYLLPWLLHVLDGEEWQIEKELPSVVYRSRVNYLSFPKR